MRTALRSLAFIITGGCGAIGGATAKAILAKGGYVVVGRTASSILAS